MCGIVGYVGRAEAAPILLDGLRRLEYRGYDSAGVAIVDGDHVETRKCAGRIAGLSKLIGGKSAAGLYGISHTRGRRTAKPPTKTRIRISTKAANSRSCTTA